MTVSKPQVLDELRRIKGPDLEGNIVDLGLVSEILVKDDRVYFSITVPAAAPRSWSRCARQRRPSSPRLPGVTGVTAVLTAEASRSKSGRRLGASARKRPRCPGARRGRQRRRAHAHDHAHAHSHTPTPAAAAQPGTGPKPMAEVPGVKTLIAVASGKGGVGKSTVAVNLALGLQAAGKKVGILDADIYGPSQPRLLGLKGQPQVVKGKTLKPMEGYGLKVMSMGFMVDEETPVIWRGPMVVGALNQMLRDVAWGEDGELDVLIIDMPPGTGDVQLTMAQQVPLSGAVIVSTPQDLALIDARKGLAMFRKVGVPVLGIVENMSYLHLPQVRRALRYLRSRRRGSGSAAARRAVPRRGAARHGRPPALRQRPADHGDAAGQPARADLPRHCLAHVGRAGDGARRTRCGRRGCEITGGGSGSPSSSPASRNTSLPPSCCAS